MLKLAILPTESLSAIEQCAFVIAFQEARNESSTNGLFGRCYIALQ